MGKKPKRPHIKIVKLDESRNWDPAFLKKTGKIFGVYVFDANSHTYAAEMTPSYELNRLDSQAERSIDEKTWDEMMQADAEGPRVDYMHTYRIDQLPKIQPGAAKQGVIDEGEKAWPAYSVLDEDWMDDVVEHYQGNPV